MSENHAERAEPSPVWRSSIERLRAAMLARLRNELLDDAHGGGAAEDRDGLGMTIRALCAEARRRGLRAEEMVVLLKRDWHTVPVTQRTPAHADAQALSRAVSLCIREYYRDA